MATKRDNPYGAFNFLVYFGTEEVGGFSDASGLGNELNYSEYRNGNKTDNTVTKVANTFKNDDVTLKRGLIGSPDLFQWFLRVRRGAYEPKNVRIILKDEARHPVAEFVLTNAQPKKWVGPTLAAKGGGEVAMEELHLVHEGIEYL